MVRKILNKIILNEVANKETQCGKFMVRKVFQFERGHSIFYQPFNIYNNMRVRIVTKNLPGSTRTFFQALFKALTGYELPRENKIK